MEVLIEKPQFTASNVLVINQSNYDLNNSCGPEIDYTQEVKNPVLAKPCKFATTAMATTASSLGSESVPEPTTDRVH